MACGRIGKFGVWRGGSIAAAVLLVGSAGLAGCAGSDDDDDAGSAGTVDSADTAGSAGSAGTTEAPVSSVPVTIGTLPPGTPLPDCGAVAAEAPAGWPYALPDGLVVTAFESDDIHYDTVGVTNDPNAVLEDVRTVSLVGFDITEPTGDADSVAIGFSGPVGGGQVSLDDGDGDGCWDVTIDATFTELPTADPASSTPNTVPVASTTPEERALSQEYAETIAIGTGQITTSRGAFVLKLTRCDPGALTVEGIAAEGEISVTSIDGATFVVGWTYADGTIVVDDAAKVVGISADEASLVADGVGADGPETLFVELACPFG